MNYIITIGGQGTRLKDMSPVDKHLLYWKDKRIIDWIKEELPAAKAIGEQKTNNRKETLEYIKDMTNVCIIDCDIIPFGLNELTFNDDTILCFESNKKKYGSVIVENKKVLETNENNSISNIKASGVYFVKSVKSLLENMKDDNSISSGMIGADVIMESSFVRMGDVEDYMEAL